MRATIIILAATLAGLLMGAIFAVHGWEQEFGRSLTWKEFWNAMRKKDMS